MADTSTAAQKHTTLVAQQGRDGLTGNPAPRRWVNMLAVAVYYKQCIAIGKTNLAARLDNYAQKF
jgi:hypothetical protein